jgi:hypothetical protein
MGVISMCPTWTSRIAHEPFEMWMWLGPSHMGVMREFELWPSWTKMGFMTWAHVKHQNRGLTLGHMGLMGEAHGLARCWHSRGGHAVGPT